MDLSPRQLSSLKEMGIPVWELRSQAATTNEDVIDNTVTKLGPEALLNSSCLVLADPSVNSESSQRLLAAMMLSIGIKADMFLVIAPEQLSQIHQQANTNKVLFVLGEDIAQSVFSQPLTRHSFHQTGESQINTVLSLNLDDLLSQPHKKASVWQDLLLVKQALS